MELAMFLFLLYKQNTKIIIKRSYVLVKGTLWLKKVLFV